MSTSPEESQDTPARSSEMEACPTLHSDLLPEISIEEFMKIKLRVGEVTACEPVPKSKKLLKLTVNLGEKYGTRQILSGISQFYTPETLVGKRVVVVANLKPAQLMGLESKGMLLAGSNENDSILAVLEPSSELPLGAEVR